jgi:NitT/TauT family transport system permease protein
VPGLGATISNATATGNYTLLLAATLTMIAVVIGVNRFVWHPLHLMAEEKYRLDI